MSPADKAHERALAEDDKIDTAIHLLPGSLFEQVFRRDIYRAGFKAGQASAYRLLNEKPESKPSK